MDISWVGTQLRTLRTRSGNGLTWGAAIVVLGTFLATTFTDKHRPAIAALCLVTGLLTILALLEFHDNAQDQAVDRLDKAHKSRIAGLNEHRLETETAHRDEMAAALARKTADYELKLELCEAQRDESGRVAAQTKDWADEVVGRLRSERDLALRERDAANGRAEAAIEEAAHIKRHADLLVVKAEEIARQSARNEPMNRLR